MAFAGWDSLIENITDPSHVNWSHHGHIGERWATTRPCAVHNRDSETSWAVVHLLVLASYVLVPRKVPWPDWSWSTQKWRACRGDEMSGYMRMTPGVQPQNIPWPEQSCSMAVESFVKRGGGMQKWEVHYFAPNLAVWFLAVPWVSHPTAPHKNFGARLSFTQMCSVACSATLKWHLAVNSLVRHGVASLVRFQDLLQGRAYLTLHTLPSAGGEH